MASAAYPTNSTTAKRLRSVPRPQADRVRPILFTQLIPGPAKSFVSRDRDGSVVPLNPRSTPVFDFRRVFPPRDKKRGFGHWGVEEVSLYRPARTSRGYRSV